MKKFSEFLGITEGHTIVKNWLTPVENVLKSNSIKYKVHGSSVTFGDYRVELLGTGYKLYKSDKAIDTYITISPVETIAKKMNLNESLSKVQKEMLKKMFNKAIDKFDDNMSVKDFAAIVAELFYEQWGQHNYSAFMTIWNNVKKMHVDDLEEGEVNEYYAKSDLRTKLQDYISTLKGTVDKNIEAWDDQTNTILSNLKQKIKDISIIVGKL